MWVKCQKDKKIHMPLPWSQRETVIFTDWLINTRGVGAGTVDSYLAGMRNVHIMQGYEEPNLKSGFIKQIIRGKKNMEFVEKRGIDIRLPVTFTLLRLLKEKIRRWDQLNSRRLLIWTVCTVAFHGSFRIHEILSQNASFYDPDFTLLTNNARLTTVKANSSVSTVVLS